jgi:hypothetical protein
MGNQGRTHRSLAPYSGPNVSPDFTFIVKEKRHIASVRSRGSMQKSEYFPGKPTWQLIPPLYPFNVHGYSWICSPLDMEIFQCQELVGLLPVHLELVPLI